MTPNGKNYDGCKHEECPAFKKDYATEERTTCIFFSEGYGGTRCFILDTVYQMIMEENGRNFEE